MEQEQVIIQEEIIQVEINNDKITEVFTERVNELIQVITISEIGPKGEPGEQGEKGDNGPPGTSNYTFIQDNFIIDNNVNSSYTLTSIPVDGTFVLFLNGIKEKSSNYILEDDLLDITPMVPFLVEGDLLAVTYAAS